MSVFSFNQECDQVTIEIEGNRWERRYNIEVLNDNKVSSYLCTMFNIGTNHQIKL